MIEQTKSSALTLLAAAACAHCSSHDTSAAAGDDADELHIQLAAPSMEVYHIVQFILKMLQCDQMAGA